jgi:uncharacterized protein YndB with AHSA1/START domain
MTLTSKNETITISATIHAPVVQVWNLWTDPKHITHWNNASDDWHTPRAENNFRVGGKFLSRMEAKDGSAGFDFTGTYNRILNHKQIEYTLADGRKVQISFVTEGHKTLLTIVFEAEQTNPLELQRAGWQAILNNFKKYAETQD